MNDTAQQPTSLQEVVKFAESTFREIAPHSMEYTAEVEFAMQLLQNNAYLMKVASECPRSLVSALKNVAAIGLSLNPAKKEAYLIPRSIKTGDNKWESRLFLEPSYMGLCNIATNTGSIDWVQARCVYADDEFIDNGVGEKPTHIYDAFSDDRGKMVGSYCVAKTETGAYLVNIMTKTQLDSIRDRSEAWKNGKKGPWATDPVQMCLKAVIRQGFKTWPKTDKFARLEQAVHISNENEGFEPLVVSNPEMTDYTALQKSYFNQLIEKSDAIGMFCFKQSIPVGVYISLYNSFESEITKYKKIVAELERSGSAQTLECQQAIEEAVGNDDEMGARQVIEDLSEEAVSFIINNTDSEVGQFIRECLKETE